VRTDGETVLLTGEVEIEQFVVVVEHVADGDGTGVTELVLRQVLHSSIHSFIHLHHTTEVHRLSLHVNSRRTHAHRQTETDIHLATKETKDIFIFGCLRTFEAAL